MRKKLLQNNYLLIVALALFKLLIHLFTNTNYDLHRDSFLYYSLGQHLDWGYVSVPPFIGFISWLSTNLFGHTAFALNFFPAFIGALSVVIIAQLVKEFGGGRLAIIISCLSFIVSPAYLRSNTLFQPVSFDQFFWLLSSLFMVKLIKSKQPKYWIYLCLVLAFGFLNKYLIAVYAFSFIIALLFTKERKLLFSKYFIFSSIAGFLIVLPNLIWQYRYNFPVVHHLGELHDYQLVNVSIKGFLIDQLLMNLPGLFVWFTGLCIFVLIKTERKYIVLSYTYLIVILILLLSHGKSYYTLGLYALFLAAGGYAIEKYSKRWMQIAILTFIIITALPSIPISLPVYSLEHVESYTKKINGVPNRWEDGKIHNIPQDYADMTGWKELASIVNETYNSLSPSEKQNCAIYAENYALAGAIKFYGRPYNIPEPISFSDNFLLWAPDSITKEKLIYVNNQIGDIQYLFRNYTLKGEINDKYFRESGVKVFYCTQPVDSFNIFYKKKVTGLKAIYKR
jgi:hypothetical protein